MMMQPNIHPIIGNHEYALMQVLDFVTREITEEAISKIDEKTLREIAKKTGGKDFRAKNTGELLEIYREIDALEPVKNDDIFVRPVKTLFYYPLAAAFGLSVLGALLMLIGRRA